MTDPVRVRFAPSPTGRLHVGGARTALFNWAWARRHGGSFVLRVEDTDAKRSLVEYEREILDGLHWLGTDWDEGPDVGGPYAPYRQSERRARHEEAAARLLAEGRAYRDFAPPPPESEAAPGHAPKGPAYRTSAYRGDDRDLDPRVAAQRAAAGEAFVVRFRVPDGRTAFRDLIRGDVSFDNAEVDDWVMLRSDGLPTYNLVVVCDDVDMRITCVLRGEEHLVNTPKQILLYEALSAVPPAFGHLPLMLGTDKKKLSKRTGDTALEDYRDKGYPAPAVLNFLALQGWAFDGATEVFSVDELVERFDPADVSKGGSVFDIDKFQWLAGEYLRKEPIDELALHCAPFVVAAGQLTADELARREAWFHAVVEGVRERIRLYSELPERIAFLFEDDARVTYEPAAEKGARKHDARVLTLTAFRVWLAPAVEGGVDAAALREGARTWVGERGLKFPALFQPLRCALTGQAGGPDLFDVIAWLGAASALARIDAGLERLA